MKFKMFDVGLYNGADVPWDEGGHGEKEEARHQSAPVERM